jgi:hypothetical protein
MSRFACLLVSLVVAIACLAGCAGKKEDESSPPPSAPKAPGKASAAGNRPAISAAPDMELNQENAARAESRLGSRGGSK